MEKEAKIKLFDIKLSSAERDYYTEIFNTIAVNSDNHKVFFREAIFIIGRKRRRC